MDAPRTHVVIDPRGRGSEEQGLFRTTGRDFGPSRWKGSTLDAGYALLTFTNAPGLDGEPRRLGGEGRFVRFRSLDMKLTQPDELLPAVPKDLDRARRLRFVLITPALFEYGWHPDWIKLSDDRNGAPGWRGSLAFGDNSVRVTLVAAAITRGQSYSGWQPTPGRGAGPGRSWRVVPAGSVFWFDVTDGDPTVLHGASLCTGQWQRDGWGYGLAGRYD